MERENVLDNVAVLEKIALDSMLPLVDKYEIVGDVRIKGLYLALEFVEDKDTKAPAKEITRQIHRRLLNKGVVGIHERGLWWIRWLPALNMPPALFQKACDLLEETIDEVSREYGKGIAG